MSLRQSLQNKIQVGILAFQGDIEEHQEALASLGIQSRRVKDKLDLKGLTHFILPGGESTVIGKFLAATDLDQEIIRRVKNKTLQIYGTCAGAILLAKNVQSAMPINNLKLIDATLARNAYGSQLDSFEKKLRFQPTNTIFQAIFIRAPKILDYGAKTKILCHDQKQAVMLEQDNVLISTFHPELTHPAIIHSYFLQKKHELCHFDRSD